MSKKVFAAIAVLAMVFLTVSCGVIAEETEELQTDEVLDEEKRCLSGTPRPAPSSR